MTKSDRPINDTNPENNDLLPSIMYKQFDDFQDEILSKIVNMLHDLVANIRSFGNENQKQRDEKVEFMKNCMQNSLREHLKHTMSQMTIQINQLKGNLTNKLQGYILRKQNEKLVQFQKVIRERVKDEVKAELKVMYQDIDKQTQDICQLKKEVASSKQELKQIEKKTNNMTNLLLFVFGKFVTFSKKQLLHLIRVNLFQIMKQYLIKFVTFSKNAIKLNDEIKELIPLQKFKLMNENAEEYRQILQKLKDLNFISQKITENENNVNNDKNGKINRIN